MTCEVGETMQNTFVIDVTNEISNAMKHVLMSETFLIFTPTSVIFQHLSAAISVAINGRYLQSYNPGIQGRFVLQNLQKLHNGLYCISVLQFQDDQYTYKLSIAPMSKLTGLLEGSAMEFDLIPYFTQVGSDATSEFMLSCFNTPGISVHVTSDFYQNMSLLQVNTIRVHFDQNVKILELTGSFPSDDDVIISHINVGQAFEDSGMHRLVNGRIFSVLKPVTNGAISITWLPSTRKWALQLSSIWGFITMQVPCE